MRAITMARKPCLGTLTDCVIETGCGLISIDDCRIPAEGGSPSAYRRATSRKTGNVPVYESSDAENSSRGHLFRRRGDPALYMTSRAGEAIGRWPANVILQEGTGSGDMITIFWKVKEVKR